MISPTPQKRESCGAVVFVLLGRTPSGALLIRTQKLLLDLRRNLLQPLLGTSGAILTVSDVRLENIYLVVGGLKLIVGGSKLICKFLGDLSRLLEVCCSHVSRAANQLKDGIPCAVHYCGWTGVFRFRRVGA
jgi:hypothetical protein